MDVTSSFALVEGAIAQYRWTPADPNFEFDLANSELPDGLTIQKDGSDVVMNFPSVGAGRRLATITVIRDRDPKEGWTGPKVRYTETTQIEWITYRSELDPFFSGLGDILLDPTVV